jgi:methyl-accepting chemotaxis protein
MLDRVSFKTVLRAVLIVMAVSAVLPVAGWAWQNWRVLDSSIRTLAVADASADAFRVLTGLRTDRTRTARYWTMSDQVTPDQKTGLREIQDREMTALRSLVTRLNDIDFAERAKLFAAVSEGRDRFTRLQSEFWAGIDQPRANRRVELGQEYLRDGLALMTALDDISARLFAQIRDVDPFVDRMMAVKQLAWQIRDSSGNASLMLTAGIAEGKVPVDFVRRYDAQSGSAAGAWRALDNTVSDVKLPAALAEVLATARRIYLAPDYEVARDKLVATLVAGQKPDVTAEQWSQFGGVRLSAMLTVAEATLDAAKTHADATRADAMRKLFFSLSLVLAMLGFVAFSLRSIQTQIIRPLQVIGSAMRQLAGGDFAVETSFAHRRDEIGSLAQALRVFRDQAVEKSQMEADQAANQARIVEQHAKTEEHIAVFERHATGSIATLASASAQMVTASEDMQGISARTNVGITDVAAAAEETASSVTGIAAAAEELSASITEISRHVSQATMVTGRAVAETRQTDETVRGLAQSAGRIGQVVKLISDIAGQTNLLALNATIEAARAGEAGKGFAVVASEVKSLASQTAKATEEISAQIAAVQNVTDETVQAIRRIGTTIEEVNNVAMSIAAGVEEQGASTQEIARNVQQAAQRSREMSETIGRVSQDAIAADTSAQTVRSASLAAGTEADSLRDHVGTFLGRIRAA